MTNVAEHRVEDFIEALLGHPNLSSYGPGPEQEYQRPDRSLVQPPDRELQLLPLPRRGRPQT